MPEVSLNNSPSTKTNDDMFLIKGKVTALYVTDGTINLLQGMQNKMAATGVAAVISDMAGTVANAAMIAMYEGEDVQHFGCIVGEHMVIGTFKEVDFEEGDEVQMVVTKLDKKTVTAHAVVREKDNLLWMPYSINKGRWKIAQWIAVASFWTSTFIFILFGIFNIFRPDKDGFLNFFFLEYFPVHLGVGIFICGGVFWSSRDDAKYAEEIFQVLGFKNPKTVNLCPYSQRQLKSGYSLHVYDLEKALAAHGSICQSMSKPAN